MRNLQVAFALAVFAAISLALLFERPRTPDAALFGEEMALAPELGPLELPRGTHTLRGRLSKADGAPAADAFVVLVRPEGDVAVHEPLYHAYTDADGTFEIDNVMEGRYRAILSYPSSPPSELPVHVPAGGIVSWTLEPVLGPLPVLPDLRRADVAGRLRAAEAFAGATPLEGFEIVLVPAADTPRFQGAAVRRAPTDATGSFSLREVVVAHYDVEILPPWALGGSWPIVGRASVDVSTGEPLDLFLDVGALEGRVVEPDGRPLVGALVRITSAEQVDAVGREHLWPPDVTDAEGRYRVDLLPPGRYHLHLRGGAAFRDLEVEVHTGVVTQVPPTTLDPRSGIGPGG